MEWLGHDNRVFNPLRAYIRHLFVLGIENPMITEI